MSKPFILVDGSSYLYRAFHAMPTLTNSKGLHTGAVYGIINMLRKLVQQYDPTHIAVVFDAKGKTFRDDLYDQYKANRSPMPSELISQIEPIHAIIKALGLPLLMVEGVEADDVIGTLAVDAKRYGQTTLISTGDKDFAQLVDSDTTLINTMTDSLLNPKTVEEKFGIPPHLIVDYLSLIGDTSDNIPGVPQVGPKTAVKWLQEYGSLDQIILKADQIKGKVGENLRASLEQIPLSKALATIKKDVALPIHFSDLKRKEPDENTLIKLYQEFELKSWLNQLLEKNPQQTQNKHAGYMTILSEKELDKWLTKLAKSPIFAFNIAANTHHYMDAEVIGVSFVMEKGKAVYIPLAHDYPHAAAQLNRNQVLQKLKHIFENPAIKKIGHQIKYNLEVLASYSIDLQGIAYDTMLESYILDSSTPNHDIDSLALKHLGWKTISLVDIAGKGVKQISFNQVSIENAATFSSESVDVILHLHQLLWPKLLESPGLKSTFEDIEIKLAPVLARIERNGVLIDIDMLKKQGMVLEKRMHELELEIVKLAGESFNINSPKQLQAILYEKLKLPILQKTPTGQASTADGVLQELALEYALPKCIIEYRTLNKLITTYINKLPHQINSKTKRIHTSYNQTGAATGRLSSSEPNLQNIPIRTEEGRRIRKAFIAEKGCKIISSDYSQIELRIMAHISNDLNLLKAFEQNQDIHTATAAEILGIPLEKVTYEERRKAKAVNFGLIYGMSAFGLAKQIGSSRETAQTYINRYFDRYPGVKTYMEETRKKAHAQGFVETLWGRRLYLPDINSSQIPRQRAAERTAINAPLQGSAADIIKRAMISLDDWLQKKKVNAKMIMQVHDELVFEVLEKDVDSMVEAIRTHMMNAAQLKVPLVVSIGVGDNWDSASGE